MSDFSLSLIVAMTPQRVIGKQGKLPWHLPRDLRRFRKLTLGKTVLMGRKTFESIGKPLEKRYNIVLTRQKLAIPGCFVASCWEEALELAQKRQREIFVIGGASLYKLAEDITQKAYVTWVFAEIKGDTYFPFSFDPSLWVETSREEFSKDEKHIYPHAFCLYTRREGEIE